MCGLFAPSPSPSRQHTDMRVYTIGHSHHAIESLLELLAPHGIEVLVDVRSAPFSKFAPQYNHDRMKLTLSGSSLKYLYLGRELGGMPKSEQFYDDDGNVVHAKIAATPLFQQGLERLHKGIASYNVVLMCGEENPAGCHRRLLLARQLVLHGIETLHLRADGRVQTEADIAEENGESIQQLSLFGSQS